MYAHNEEPLTKEEIYAVLRQENLIEDLILKRKIDCYERITSPFRKDANPRCYFEWCNGKLWFLDFSDNPTHRDIFNMIQDYFDLTFYEARKVISDYIRNNPLSTGAFSRNNRVHPEQSVYPRDITFKSGIFLLKDKSYWYDKYGITKEQLEKDRVFRVIWYRLFSRKIKKYVIIRPGDNCYAYTDFESGNVKIYRPFEKGTVGKWTSNCTENDIGNIRNLTGDTDTLIITKAYKCCRVLINAGALDVIWFQSEGVYPSRDALFPSILKHGYKRVVLIFDNDGAGIRNVVLVQQYLREMLPPDISIETLQIPSYPDLKIKDSSDMRELLGEDALKQFLKNNRLL